MTIKGVWKRKSTERFYPRNPPHKKEAFFKGIQKAGPHQLDVVGYKLNLTKLEALNVHHLTFPETEGQRTEVYRYELMTRVEDELCEMSGKLITEKVTERLELLAALLGLGRRYGESEQYFQLYDRARNACEKWFRGEGLTGSSRR